MKALIYRQFGTADTLEWADNIPRPEISESSVLVQMKAGSINPKDVLLRKGKFSRTLARRPLPRISGMDGAGKIAAIGKNVIHFNIGDRIYGMTNHFAGGVHGEYALFDQDEIYHLPAGLTFEQAAGAPLAAQTALQALRDCSAVAPGDTVLINGASGGVGHFAIQVAKALGAVTHAVCGPQNIDFVTALGANHVYNYQECSPTRINETYDCIFDVFGNYTRSAFSKQLKKDGVYVSTVPKPSTIWPEALARIGMFKKSRLVNVTSRSADLAQLNHWFENGDLQVHVEKSYPVEEAARAHQHIESRHAIGKTCITFE